MKMRQWRAVLTAALAALLGVAAPAAASADVARGLVATLRTPLAAPRQAIIDGVMWRCSGATCTAADVGQQARMACGQVAKRVGPVDAFATGERRFSADELARCNAGR